MVLFTAIFVGQFTIVSTHFCQYHAIFEWAWSLFLPPRRVSVCFSLSRFNADCCCSARAPFVFVCARVNSAVQISACFWVPLCAHKVCVRVQVSVRVCNGTAMSVSRCTSLGFFVSAPVSVRFFDRSLPAHATAVFVPTHMRDSITNSAFTSSSSSSVRGAKQDTSVLHAHTFLVGAIRIDSGFGAS